MNHKPNLLFIKSITIYFLTCFIFASQANALPIEIFGIAPSYKNSEVSVTEYSNPITSDETERAKIKFDEEGNFRVNINLAYTQLLIFKLGVFKGYLYAEPGGKYEIILPEKTDKSPEDLMNPFFEKIEIQLAVINNNSDELNFLIRSFNSTYTPYFNKFAQYVNSRGNNNFLDSAIMVLEKPYANISNTYFNQYKTYKIAILKHLAFKQKTKQIWNHYFKNKPIQYNNPAWTELFGYVFTKYFTYYSRSTNGKNITTNISSKSYSQLKHTLQSDEILQNDTLCELVILKNLHDEFYASNFSRNAMLVILDSLANYTTIPLHKKTAEIIRKKVTKLMAGYDPPYFELYNKDNKLVKLSDFSGKYVYLNFCSCNSYTCLKEFEMLKTLYETHKDKLEIVTIISDEGIENMKEFVTKSAYQWTFLHINNQPDILHEYDIRAFPTYYFIDTDGKLVFSPSSSPADNFEIQWFKYIKSKKEVEPTKDLFR